jgi:hypothetical protein
MKSISRTMAVLGAVCASAACASQPTPASTAATVAQNSCPTTGAQAWVDMRAINQTKAVEVQPVMGATGGDQQVLSKSEPVAEGVKVLVQPPPMTTTADLQRAMQCRYAQAQLGQIRDTSAMDAPFYLKDRWVNVTVRNENNGLYAVFAKTDDVNDNRALMSRTREYATAHGIPIASNMP